MGPLKTTVVGAGTMGNGIAHVLAQHGHQVRLVDERSDALTSALSTIRTNLERQIKRGVLAVGAVEEVLGRITPSADLAAAAADTDLAIEAVTEEFSAKASVFDKLDAAAPEDAILATNTSSISITRLGAFTNRPDRVIGMHFFNPVPVMKLVEIVRGLETSEDTFERIHALAKDVGKEPIEVQDFPGFVSNRILMPMINEACYCVMEGVAEVEDVDTVMKLGMGHPMGPLTLADFIGLDVCLSIMNVLHEQLGDDKYRPCPLLRKLVAAGRLGRKTGRGFHEYAGD